MIDRFSYSSLETYKKCPAQFKFRYIDKIYKQDEGIEAFMGKRVHEALEYLYGEVMAHRLPFLDGVMEKYHEVWENQNIIMNWESGVSLPIIVPIRPLINPL
jgi:RecB family exonuclease